MRVFDHIASALVDAARVPEIRDGKGTEVDEDDLEELGGVGDGGRGGYGEE